MSAASKGKILLIEDDAALRSVYADAIAEAGYTIFTAEDGEQGLAMVKKEKPDLVLLDLILPKLPGFEVLKNIRANDGTKDTIVLIMSMLEEQRHVLKAKDLGANGYAIKGSSTPHEILRRIEALLNPVAEEPANKSVKTYNLFVKATRGDSEKLQNDLGTLKLFTCAVCRDEMQLTLIPDNSRSDGHWFSAHFTCSKCGWTF